MAWVVLSTSSVLDAQEGSDLSEEQLERIVRSCGYNSLTLQNIMRNSASISSATAPESFGRYSQSVYKIPESIRAGSCSTVSGTRPTCYLYKDSDDVNYEEIARCVNHYLENNKANQTAILCNRYISPRQIRPLLAGDVTLYNAGVEEFGGNAYTPRHFREDLAKQREDLVKWIKSGGILLTHNKMFRGCEAQSVVYIAHKWCSFVQARSGPTRAVSELCLVTSDDGIKQDEIKQYFNVIQVDRLEFVNKGI